MQKHIDSPKERETTTHFSTLSQNKGSVQFKDNRRESEKVAKIQNIADDFTNKPIQKKNNTGLPDKLKNGIENLSGHSMDDVKVHYNSAKPAQLNAHAYAQGTNIHLASGQEKHLPHEAWHIVQQKQGRVKPTMQMKGKVNINDDAGLEKEADVMGEKALQFAGGKKLNLKAYTSTSSSLQAKNIYQLKLIEKSVTGVTHIVEMINGSLYNEDFQSNERITVGGGMKVTIDPNIRYRSRRGPNQEIHGDTDKIESRHYLWYLVKSINSVKVPINYFIREDTITNLEQESALAHQLSGTIYGTDGSNAGEIAEAYHEGYRDFDCAFEYHGGQTYAMFRKFKINRGSIRIIYKFKLSQFAGASSELSKLARTPGIIIHTVMLHEIPETDEKIEAVIEHLALLGQTYHAKIGISNVKESGYAIASDLTSLEKQLSKKGVRLSVVENRMNPAIPDKKIRDYCKKNKIQYLAYGLAGPSGIGTCGAVPGVGSGDYKFLKDPELIEFAKQIGVKPDQIRALILTWAREQGTSVITRSSDPTRREQNKSDVSVRGADTHGFLDSFSRSEVGIYRPYLSYLQRQEVPESIITELSSVIHSNWLTIYYKKVIVELGDDPLLNLLMNGSEFEKLKSAPGINEWSDLTEMRDWIISVITGSLIVGPKTLTNAKFIKFAKENALTIYNAVYAVYTKIEELNGLAIGDEITLSSGKVTIYYKVIGGQRLEKKK